MAVQTCGKSRKALAAEHIEWPVDPNLADDEPIRRRPGRAAENHGQHPRPIPTAASPPRPQNCCVELTTLLGNPL